MQDQEYRPVVFSGTAREYFGVWIVNLLLSIVTLGIYSAWAKVRRLKYFYQHTEIEGRRFDYHATGKQIFIGRLIVIVAYVVFQIIVTVLPPLGLLLLLALILYVPTLINKAYRFHARMTSWSGLRFDFEGNYWGALRTMLLYPILAVFTLYLALPFVIRAQHSYSTNNHRYGTAKFHFESPIGPFYKAFVLAILWMLVIGGIGLWAIGAGEVFTALAMETADPTPEMMIRFGLIYVVALVALVPMAFIYKAFLRNAVFAGTQLEGGHKFRSTISPAGLLWVAFSNAFLVVISLGLLTPLASIRMTRYLAANTFVAPNGSLDEFVGGEAQKTSAIGDAYVDFEGIDLGVAM